MKIEGETSPSKAKDDLFEPKKGHIWGGTYFGPKKTVWDPKKAFMGILKKERDFLKLDCPNGQNFKFITWSTFWSENVEMALEHLKPIQKPIVAYFWPRNWHLKHSWNTFATPLKKPKKKLKHHGDNTLETSLKHS